MGLDLVELVFEMEGTFGIVFEDLEAEKIGTVGQAYRYILSQLELRQTIPCPSASLFYKLRQALMAQSVVDRREVRPSARIADFLPQAGRRDAWNALRDEVGLSMPPLEFGEDLKLAAWLLGLGPVLGLAVIGWSHDKLSAGATALATLLFGSISLLLAFLVLSSFARQIPTACETIRGTIEVILGRDRLASESLGEAWEPDQVWFTLRELIAEQTGVPRDQIMEETSFVHDLGMD